MDICDDIIKHIFLFLSDNDFCQFIMTSKNHYSYYKRYKSIISEYPISNIKHISSDYLFTNIIYDYTTWNINIIPESTQKIKFIDEFNDDLTNIKSLKNLNKIYVGIFFTKYESIINLTYLINYEQILIFIVSNIVSINNNLFDVKIYFNKESLCKYPRTFGNRCRNNIWSRRICNIIGDNIDQDNIDQNKYTLQNIINNLYSSECQLNKSMNTILHVITKLSFIDVIYDIFPLRIYVEMYYDMTNKNNILSLAIFLYKILKYNDKFISLLEKKLCSKYDVLKMGDYVSKITNNNISRRNNIIESNNII